MQYVAVCYRDNNINSSFSYWYYYLNEKPLYPECIRYKIIKSCDIKNALVFADAVLSFDEFQKKYYFECPKLRMKQDVIKHQYNNVNEWIRLSYNLRKELCDEISNLKYSMINTDVIQSYINNSINTICYKILSYGVMPFIEEENGDRKLINPEDLKGCCVTADNIESTVYIHLNEAAKLLFKLLHLDPDYIILN